MLPCVAWRARTPLAGCCVLQLWQRCSQTGCACCMRKLLRKWPLRLDLKMPGSLSACCFCSSGGRPVQDLYRAGACGTEQPLSSWPSQGQRPADHALYMARRMARRRRRARQHGRSWTPKSLGCTEVLQYSVVYTVNAAGKAARASAAEISAA